MIHQTDSNELKALLENVKTIAVVGLSDQPDRTSHYVSKYMQEKGYTIIPVNPTVSEVLGQKCYASLSDIGQQVDLVNVFRRSEFLSEIAKETVEAGIPSFWAQLGLFNENAYNYLQEHGVQTIMDKCIMVEHSRLV